MPGCIDCKHNKSEWGFINSKHTLLSRSCGEGLQGPLDDWWESNGNRNRKEGLDDMECFEATDTSKSLDKMNDLAQDMLDILDKVD